MENLWEAYQRMNGKPCACGKIHRSSLDKYVIEAGAIALLPELVAEYGANRPFLLADSNTWEAAGAQAQNVLTAAGYPCGSYVFPQGVKPEEHAVGSVMMHFDAACDILIAVGSGVINDIGKIISHFAGRPYFIVATAPSMDGYNSATSSMERDGVKVSLPTRCPNVIVGDLNVLCQAPKQMLQAGLGDMMAKYISICEWRIAALLMDEPYCEAIANLVRKSLACCMSEAQGLLERSPAAVANTFESLIICGAAAEFAGSSRPASGVEHYISHIWDMRGLCFGTPTALHGIQCAIGTVQTLRAYQKIRQIRPDRERALEAVDAFNFDLWSDSLRKFVGKGAESMIMLEAKEKKYDKVKHAVRLEKIIRIWPAVCAVIDDELPAAEDVERTLVSIGAPKEPEEIGIDRGLLPMTFMASKDIRDKYVLPRLAWDLGILDELAQCLV